MPSIATTAEVSMTIAASVRQPTIVIADNLVVGTTILNRKFRAAPTDFQDLLAQAPSLPSPHSRETLAKGLNDGGGERLAGGLRHFSRQTVGFRIFYAQGHNGV
jgi:hypothetical protein